MANNLQTYRMRFVLAEAPAAHSEVAYLTSSRLSGQTAKALLERRGHRVAVFASLDQLTEKLTLADVRVVLVDASFSGGTWKDAVETLCSQYPDICVLVVSDAPGEAEWEEVILAGGYDAVPLSRLAEELAPAVESASKCADICVSEASRARQAALMEAIRDSVRDSWTAPPARSEPRQIH